MEKALLDLRASAVAADDVEFVREVDVALGVDRHSRVATLPSRL